MRVDPSWGSTATPKPSGPHTRAELGRAASLATLQAEQRGRARVAAVRGDENRGGPAGKPAGSSVRHRRTQRKPPERARRGRAASGLSAALRPRLPRPHTPLDPDGAEASWATGNTRTPAVPAGRRPRSPPATPSLLGSPSSAPHTHTEAEHGPLTQLATEQSPSTLPIATASAGRAPTKWRQRLSRLQGLFTTCEPLPAQSPSRPPPCVTSAVGSVGWAGAGRPICVFCGSDRAQVRYAGRFPLDKGCYPQYSGDPSFQN